MLDLYRSVFFNTDENGNGEIPESTETTDEFDDVDLSLIEEDGATPDETPQIVKLGDNEVNLDDLTKIYEDYSNDTQWKAKNTQEAQRLAEEKRRYEAELQALEARKADLESFEQGLYNQRNQSPTPTEEQQAQFNRLSEEDKQELDPATRAIYENLERINQRLDLDKQENEKREFINRMQAEHDRLKSFYPDYEPTRIERSIIQGRNQFEDAYLSDAFRKVKQGDETAIRSLIPNDLMIKIEQEQRQKVIADAKAKQKARSKISTLQPGGVKTTGNINTNNTKPKSWNDVKQRSLQYLRDNNLSLTTE